MDEIDDVVRMVLMSCDDLNDVIGMGWMRTLGCY